jgi:hypothetical protein
VSYQADLSDAAEDEIERALTLGWAALARLTPWGDTFEGFTPEGREVRFERTYLWNSETGGDIRVEVNVYEVRDFEGGVRMTRSIEKETLGSSE